MEGNSFAPGVLLGRVRPNVLTPVVLVPVTEIRTEITLILVSRTTDNTLITIYHDVGGATFDTSNEIITDARTIALGANYPVFQSQGPGTGIMLEIGDSLGVEAGVVDDVVVSAYGVTQTLAERVRGV